MKKIGIMQPYLFPYLGYFQHINAVDKFVLLDDVNFIKRGYINRNQILLNKQAHLFSLPLVKASQNKLILETSVRDDKVEMCKLITKIELAYKKAPFFKDVMPLVSDIIQYNNLNLSNYLAHSIRVICKYLDIKTEIVDSSRKYEKGILRGQDRILDIVLKEKGSIYINPVGGQEIYDKDLFKEKGVDLFFHKMDTLSYDQNMTEFIPYLSIIDVMMFNSVTGIKELLNKYTLI
jgi:hypothetical protein